MLRLRVPSSQPSSQVPLSPTIGFYYDFDQVEDFYADVGVSRASADKWAIGGYVAYSDSLDKNVLPTQPVDFFVGFSLSRAF